MKIKYTTPASRPVLMRSWLALLIGACVGAAQAGPTLPRVVSGQASFVQQGNVFSITNTPNTIINWQSFSVNAGEVTRFIQQGSNSAVLNRILGQDPSQILGALQSNGQVFLINPNGIMFGRDARIDVQGLTASTLNLTNADFLAGKKNFVAGATAGDIANQGTISTPTGGQVFLIASNVSNSGLITSPQGQVVLAAGHDVQLVDSSNPDLHVVVAAPAHQSINLGQIIAQGGKVGIYGALVKQRGVVNANSAQVGVNGQIVLKASADAMLEAGSVTSATGAGRGGDISVQGTRVGLTGDARIDASGATGGGSVLVGGGYQGKNPLIRNAQQTLLGKDASIKADAIDSGNGGTVVLWSDLATRAIGQVSAQGGAASGNGGLVETSGKYLEVHGIRLSAGARNGAAGTWLLDPSDIEVVESSGVAGLPDVDQFSDGGGPTRINASELNSVINTTNLVLQATNDITFSFAVNPTLSAGSLKVDAGNNINVNAALSTGGGDVMLTANHASSQSGNGQINVGSGGSINTGGGKLIMSGTQVNLAGSVDTANGELTIYGGNSLNIDNNITSGTGNLTATATDIIFGTTGSSASSGTGIMQLNATGGNLDLGSNWTLSSDAAINVFADSVSLLGMIGPATSVRPTLTFNPYTPNTDIMLVTGGGGSELRLDPVRLVAFDTAQINIGRTSHTGNITFASAYGGANAAQASTLVFKTQGNIVVNQPITLGNGTLVLDIEGANQSSSITMGAAGQLAADYIVMQANNMSIGANITGTGANGGNVSLMPHMSSGQILIGAGAADAAGILGLSDVELNNISARHLMIGDSGQSGSLSVTAGGLDLSVSRLADSKLMLDAGSGDLILNGQLRTPGGLGLRGKHLQSAAGMRARADAIYLSATSGIGTDAAPFNTQTGYLSAANNRESSVEPINIANMGTLTLGSVHQNGAGNEGAITVANLGGMTLLALDPENSVPVSVRTAGAGKVTLKTASPLTLHGSVHAASGAVTLEAGNGGELSISPDAQVTSGAGNIALVAGRLINNGTVNSSEGSINIAAASVTGEGTFSAPGGAVNGLPSTTPIPDPVPEPIPEPSVGECLANPAAGSCGSVLAAALNTCIANPQGSLCGAVLPAMAVCIAAPSTPGCSVVLPTFDACVAAPQSPGCSIVLPSLPACTAAPSTPGCTAVLPSMDACVANPAAAGCVAVLPALASCIVTPSAAGCSVVLPSLDTCIGRPTSEGCLVVLPSVPACVVNPWAPGCAVVLPSLAACIAVPATAGCSAVLPALTTCIANPSAPGCIVVLPSLGQCVVNPALPACSVVLPALAQCVTTPTAAGCSAVLPSVSQCIANPSAPGCSVVLPSLSHCVATPTAAGCAVVLPTLAQCTGSPTLQGCTVVLPPVSACVANPAAPGCAVVVPPRQAPAGGQLDTAIQSTVVVTNAAVNSTGTTAATTPKLDVTKDEKKDEKKDDQQAAGSKVADKQEGSKNEKSVKTFCN